MQKLEKTAPELVSVLGVPLAAVVEALGAPDVIIKGEVDVNNWQDAKFDGTVTKILSMS